MPNNDIIPDSPENLYEWAQNFTDKALAQLTGIDGWDVNRINSLISRVGTIRDTAKAVVDALAVVKEKLGDLEGAKSTHLASIRQDFSNIIVSGGYNSGIGEVLEILTDSATFNPLAYKPVITRTTSFGGHNEIMTKKRGVTSMNVYWRRKGEETWRLLAPKRVKFPVQDDNAPAPPRPNRTPRIPRHRSRRRPRSKPAQRHRRGDVEAVTAASATFSIPTFNQLELNLSLSPDVVLSKEVPLFPNEFDIAVTHENSLEEISYMLRTSLVSKGHFISPRHYASDSPPSFRR